MANYYTNITENMFNEIYDFLGENLANSIVANRTVLYGVVHQEIITTIVKIKSLN